MKKLIEIEFPDDFQFPMDCESEGRCPIFSLGMENEPICGLAKRDYNIICPFADKSQLRDGIRIVEGIENANS